MDKLNHYRSIIRRIVAEYLEYLPHDEALEYIRACDSDSDQYLLLAVGWNPPRHIVDIYFYLRIKDEKVWVELDWTKRGIVPDLLNAGIPPEDIELGFQPPEMRPYTELAEMVEQRRVLRENNNPTEEQS